MPTEIVDATPDPRRRRALYRASHRGTKEMDWLLGRYAAARLGAMTDAELALFETVLALPDPDLQAWIMTPVAGAVADGAIAAVVAEIRCYHGLVETQAP